MNGIDPKVMADYVATANNPTYKGDYNVINAKFPELKGYDAQLLKDYVATANNPAYKGDYGVINSKFPELFSDTPQPVEQKKNQDGVISNNPNQSTVQDATVKKQQTNQQVPTVVEAKPNVVSSLFNQYSTTVDIARATNKVVGDKTESDIDKAFTTPTEFGSKYMPKSKQREFEQTNPNAAQKSTAQPIDKQPNQWANNGKIVEPKIDDSDKLRPDGTEKGKGFYGEITVQDGANKGKAMTEQSVSFEVDGKEVLTPLLNPYASLEDIENLRGGGQPSEQMIKDAERWLNYSLENNRSPFATEEEKVDVYTDEDNKIKFKTATDLQNYVVSNMDEDDRKVLVGEPNPYAVGTTEYQNFAQKETSRDMLNENMTQFSKDTGFQPEAYLDYQNYLINGGTSFDAWKKEYNPQSKIGVDEAAALTLAALPTLIYDVVFREGDMIKRIAKGTGEFATGIRTGSIMGDVSYITQGLFTLTKEGKYNPFKSAGELKQTDVEWSNRFDRSAKDEVAMFMGSIGVDYMPFEAAGNITNKMIQTLTKANASNYYNLMLRTGVLPESAMGITEKIVSSGLQMGGTLGIYTGAQSTLNQMMYSTPEEFLSEGWKTVLNDVTSSALTGVVAGGIGGAMGVLTNQIKNKIINDAVKNGILDATKLQKFAYVGTGIAGGTLSTILEASTFVAMSGEEFNAKNVLKESIKFATLKFQNPAGIKIDKLQNRTKIDPRFSPDKAWTKEFEPKLNEAELDMLGCKDIAEVKELVKKEGVDVLAETIPTATAYKLANAEYGIIVPAKDVDFAPDNVTITNEVINGKEYSVVNSWNKQGELTHVSPHENYKDAATEVEFITNKMEEYKVYKAADRLKPEWYAEFNKTVNVDKIALNDALQSKELTPEQSDVIKDFNKQVDDFIAKKEKETPNEKPKKKEAVVDAEKPKETKIEYNGEEYTVTEKDGQVVVQVKDAYGKNISVRDTEIETKVKELYDTQDKSGLPSEVREGQKPIEEKPIESTSGKEIETGGDVQAPKEKEVSDKTQLFAANKENMPTLAERNSKFDVIKKQTVKALKDLKKFTEEDFKTFVNDIRKAHSGVSEFLTPAENKTILTQIEFGTKADTKAREKSITKIGEILEKAQDRLIESDVTTMEKGFDSFLETTKVNKQKKQVEGKTTKEFTDFAKKVKEAALQEPDVIETKLDEAYDKIISGTDVESAAAKSEVESLIYAQDYSTFNQNKQIFENSTSTRTDKMIAYYEMMDIYDKFLSKNPAEYYKKAVNEKMKILEAQKVEVQKKVEIMQNPDLRVGDIPKAKELFDITDNLRTSTGDKQKSLSDLLVSVDKSKTFSPKDKTKITKAINKVKNNPLITDKKTMANKILKSAGLTKLQKDVTREKPKIFTNPLRKMLNRFDNLQQMGKVLGWKNREIRDYFTGLTDVADNSAIKADKKTNVRLKDIAKLQDMIYNHSKILANWTQRTNELGVKETLVDAEGKPFTDFDKLSLNDIVYIDRLLKTKQNKDIISKVYGEDAINILQKHCEDVMKDPKLKEISDYVFEDLQNKVYDINNEQYVKENNVDLPKFEDYVARFAVRTDKVMGKTDVKGSLKPSATRVRSIASQLKTDVNIIDMIDKAYSEAITYNAFSDVNTEMRRVLMNDKVKNAILTKVAEGDTVWKNLNKLYEAYPQGVKINETIVPKVISNAVIAKLRMNPTMVLKQASSASNSYADYIKTVNKQKLNYVPGLVEAMYAKDLLPDKYTGQFLKSALNNKALQTRLQTYGIDPHLADYMQKTFIEMGLDKMGVTKNANTIKFFRALEKFKDIQGLPVKYGDIAAFWGAKPLFNIYYKKALGEGMSKEQAGEYAIDNAYKSWAKTNQSIWSHNMSAFQLSPVGKLFAYYTSPIQMGQQNRGAIRDIFAPSSTATERVNGAKSLAYYAAFQKTIFMLAGAASTGLVKYAAKTIGQSLGNSTNPDDSFDDLSKVLDIPEEKMDVIAKILEYQSATQGIPVIDELTTIVADAMKEGKYSEKDIISTVGMIENIGTNVGKITDVLSKKGFDNWTDKEKREIVRFTAQIGDMVTGYGVSPSNRIYEYVTGKDILNDAEATKKEEKSVFNENSSFTEDGEGGFSDTNSSFVDDSAK